jgi:hypothetical protein
MQQKREREKSFIIWQMSGCNAPFSQWHIFNVSELNMWKCNIQFKAQSKKRCGLCIVYKTPVALLLLLLITSFVLTERSAYYVIFWLLYTSWRVM